MSDWWAADPVASSQGGNWWAADPVATDVNPVADFAKSIPRGMVSGLVGSMSGPTAPDSPIPINPHELTPAPERVKALENLTGEMYQPQGRAGKFGAAVGEALGNPLSYIGPGTLPLKLGASVLGSVGSEAGGQAAEGTKYETAAKIGGALAGGVTGAKLLGPAAEAAAVPTLRELKIAADKSYTAARNSGLEVNPKGLAEFATQQQQELTTGTKYAFTGGPEGTAPKTLAVLDKLQAPPAGATVTASNLDTLRRQINNIAGETKDFKPTADAKAAMVLKRGFADYLENIPQDHIVAGDAKGFVQAIKEANGNYAAASRLGNVDARIEKAGNQTNRQIAGSLDARIKSNVGTMLDKPKSLRGLTTDEIKQIQLINSGTLGSNTLRQLGRGGAGVVPLMGQAAMGGPLAMATGGASVIPQLGLMAGLYGARKGAERMTVSRANELADMLAKRSPLYQSRASGVSSVSSSPYVAAMIRALTQIH